MFNHASLRWRLVPFLFDSVRCDLFGFGVALLSIAVNLCCCSGASLWGQQKILEVHVVDASDQPIANAEVEVFDWTGELKPTDFRGRTNEVGTLELLDFKMEYYCYIVVRHPDFAPSVTAFSDAENEKSKTTIRLAKPNTNFIQVVAPDGKPLAGAEVTRLEFSSGQTQAKSFLNHSMFQTMMGTDGSEYRSDADGRLQLPPMPEDAELSVTVTHPDWAVGKLEKVKLSELHQAPLTMAKGTTVEAYFSGSPEAMERLNGQAIDLRTFDRDKNRLMHAFPVQDSKISFTLLPGRYDSLNLNAKGVAITPSLPSSSMLAEFWNIPDTDRVRKTFVVRELYPTTGKVVDAAGKPVRDITVTIEYENLYVNEDGVQQVVKEHPTSMVLVETDQNGVFNTELPKGKNSISIWWTSGYYSIPEKLEFDFNFESELPEYQVVAMPTLTGRVVDENDQPVANAAVRVLSHNSNSEYIFSGDDGSFSLPITTLGYDLETKERSFLTEVVAFEINSSRCCIQKVDVSDAATVGNCELKVGPQPAKWLSQELNRRAQEEFDRMVAASNYIAEEIEAAKQKQEADLEEAKSAPELSAGTWINSTDQSLAAFRGKYVLLDFWFIGCGPCERELPKLNMAYKQFRDAGFMIIGVHIAGQSAENVAQFAEAKGMKYPIVIDTAEEPILNAYRPLGVQGFPTHILIDPEGNIDTEASLHGGLLECIREKVLLRQAGESSELSPADDERP